MVPLNTYSATCRREGHSWVVSVPELGMTARAARLTQVDAVARGLVAAATRDDPTSARVVLDLQVPDDVKQLLDAAAAARQTPDRVSVESVTLRRGLARRLAGEGFTVRDIGSLLGVSYPRAQQLVGDGLVGASAPPAAGSGHPARVRQPAAPSKPHESYRHEAVLYHGTDDFLTATLGFVREGIALGQPVMVAVAAPRLELLRGALGDEGAEVHFVDMARLGHNPARIIPSWLEFIDDRGGAGRPVRGVDEPVWAGRRPAEIAECQLHEAMLNLAVEPDTPMWLRCPYDASALPEPLLREVLHSHPVTVQGGDYRGSTAYGGAYHVDAVFTDELPRPSVPVTDEMAFGVAGIATVRKLVGRRAAEAGVGSEQAADLALAVTEIATNSVRHGGGRGLLRVWREPGALVCEVSDRGHIGDPLVGRRMPSTDGEGGRGVWLTNQLGDLVQIRSSADRGTAVRILTWTDVPAEQPAGAVPVA